LTASVDDTTTGNSILASAGFQVAGGARSPMLAGDGGFDSPIERVSAYFSAPSASTTVEVCVRGTDIYGNIGNPACDQLELNAPAGPPPLFLPIAIKNFSTP